MNISDELKIVKPLCAGAEELNYETEFTEKYPSLSWLFEMLREDYPARSAYYAALNVAKIFELEAETYGADTVRHIDTRSFNPGGNHLRITPDGNIYERKPDDGYLPRHLGGISTVKTAAEKESFAQTARRVLQLEG